ncbi:hypothetical protein BH09PAT1_BH09PAT1_7760 [soil metagenome]
MVKYGPESGPIYKGDKVIRVDEAIHFAPAEISHTELAFTDGIAERIRIVRSQRLLEVDAGFYAIENGIPQVVGRSVSLNLPSDERARVKTNSELARQHLLYTK